MTDILNLRQARKAKARQEKARQAEQNRLLHGRAGAEKKREKALREKSVSFLENHRRERDGDGEL